MSDPKVLADRWWEESDDFRSGNAYWLKAEGILRGGDRRVLLIGPGPDDPRRHLTLAAEQFLRRAGFEPVTIDAIFSPDEHRQQAEQLPRILALPLSVGSSAEVLDFLNNGLQDRLSMVMSAEHSTGYFAQLVSSQGYQQIGHCNSLGGSLEETDPELGKLLLVQLGRLLVKEEGRARAARETEQAPEQSSAQARAAQELSQDDPGGGGQDRRTLISSLAALCGALLAPGVAGLIGQSFGAAFGACLLALLTMGLLYGSWYRKHTLTGRSGAVGAVIVLLAIVAGATVGKKLSEREQPASYFVTKTVGRGFVPRIKPDLQAEMSRRQALRRGDSVKVVCLQSVRRDEWARLEGRVFVPSRVLQLASDEERAGSC